MQWEFKKITCNLHLKLATSQQVVRTACSQTKGLNKTLHVDVTSNSMLLWIISFQLLCYLIAVAGRNNFKTFEPTQ